MADVETAPASAVPSGAVGLSRARANMATLATIAEGSLEASIRADGDGVWLFVPGRAALRTAWSPGGLKVRDCTAQRNTAQIDCDTALGDQRVMVEIANGVIRASVTLTPAADLLLQYWPRDFYPIDRDDDPLGARGRVEAAQRGFNAALVFVTRRDGAGTALYFQNLTALNPFFIATGTKPDGVVGGRWPELGYRPPTAPHFERADDRPLKNGVPLLISDARLVFDDPAPRDARAAAATFLALLGRVYATIEQPPTVERDWPLMARRTLKQLQSDRRLTVRHYGHRYLYPYPGHGQPDSMVQLAVARPMTLLPEARALADAFIAGMAKFHDRKLGSVRRFLPNVVKLSKTEGDEKDPDEVDSWYLYHPLTNLGTLALAGDARARRLFLKSLNFAVRVARHFDYHWPVLFDVVTLQVKTGPRKPGDPGQSDVAGLYAEVMLKAWELTGEQRFIDEAQASLRAIDRLRFDLCYQTNLTARGLVPCLRLWRETGDDYFLKQSFVFLAGFFHNTIFWESEIDAAADYRTFLGATCLHDGPYMAIFECFESAEALNDYLALADDAIPAGVARLIRDYVRHALHRAWYFYPTELPRKLLSPEQRTGMLDPTLAIPLEDLYADGQPPGQVGQEIYGAGAAFAFAALMARGLN